MSLFEKEKRGTSRREFLQASLGGLATLALGGSVLTGCGGSDSNNDTSSLSSTPTRLLMSTFLLGTVEAYNASTFRSEGTFVPSKGIGITTAGIVRGPSNNVFIFSPGGDAVFVYDKNTGAAKGTLPTPPKGLITPHSGVIGADGNLYVVNAPTLNGNIGKGTDSIEAYDANNFQRLGTFASVRSPFGITVQPGTGDLFVSSTLQYSTLTNETDYITRINQRGEYQGIIARDLKIPFTMAFHPSGDLLVVEHFDGTILRYTPDGQLVGTFARLDYPVGITYGPDGDLYAASFTTPDRYLSVLNGDLANALGGGSVLRFDGNTGAPKGTVLSGLPLAGFLAFV